MNPVSKIGATTESVARYIKTGEFGLWKETGELNDIVRDAAKNRLGFGESVGKFIAESAFPHKNLSILAAAYRKRVPATVHVGVTTASRLSVALTSNSTARPTAVVVSTAIGAGTVSTGAT